MLEGGPQGALWHTVPPGEADHLWVRTTGNEPSHSYTVFSGGLLWSPGPSADTIRFEGIQATLVESENGVEYLYLVP